jgi:DNA polymerase V
MKPVFGLIDCDNFFVSCERLFRPDLANRPVVVLSSNDGCVVSRSNEAKELAIPMGAPAFKYRQLFKEQGVVQFSANFELYGDISERITRLLASLTPRTEVYSVDEAFLELSHLEISDYGRWGRALARRLLKEVGIPVSVGLAPTKTLAKLGADRAKKDMILDNILDLMALPETERARYLLQTPVNDVWGVGWRLTPKLRAEGIYNAFDLARLRPQRAQQLMGIHGRQMVAELNGVCCQPLQALGKIRQSITHGRMFGEDTNKLEVLEAAIASLTTRAAVSLRAEGLLARTAAVHISTNRHKPGYQKLIRSINLPTPTADAGQITAEIITAITPAFNPKASWHRVNILLYDLVGQYHIQPDLFGEVDIERHNATQSRLQAVDALNARYGRSSVHYAAEDLSDAWQPRKGSRSPRYTTSWKELPTVEPAAQIN